MAVMCGLQSRGAAGRDCGACTGRVHQPVLDAVSARVLNLSSGPAMAGPEWTHLFAAKCHQVSCAHVTNVKHAAKPNTQHVASRLVCMFSSQTQTSLPKLLRIVHTSG